MDHRFIATAITSLNRKGGVGKTHFCWLVGSACFDAKKRVLLVDLDPQANLTSSFLGDADADRSVEQLFDPSVDPDAESLILSTEFDGVDLIPSSHRLEPANITDNWQAADLYLSLTEALQPVCARYDYAFSHQRTFIVVYRSGGPRSAVSDVGQDLPLAFESRSAITRIWPQKPVPVWRTLPGTATPVSVCGFQSFPIRPTKIASRQSPCC